MQEWLHLRESENHQTSFKRLDIAPLRGEGTSLQERSGTARVVFLHTHALILSGVNHTLNRRRVIFDLILCYKYLHGLVETNNCNFIRIYQSIRTRGNGMKLYKEQCSIDARHQFFTMGDSVAEWLACRTQARKSTGSNPSRGAVE